MTNDTNITEGFIAMVEAYKAKPELERQIETLKQDVDFFDRNLRTEEDISRNLRYEIAELKNSLAEAIKQRDGAMFRNLELEELKDKIGTLAGQLLGSLKQSDPQPSQVVTQPEAAGPIMSQSVELSEPMVGYPGPIVPVVVEPQGQSATDPTSSTSTMDGHIENATTTSKDGTEIQTQSNPAPSLTPGEPDGWERGKPYSYKPWYMTDAEWVSRGGFGPAKSVVAIVDDYDF